MQKNNLLGQVAIITGAARRIGAEIARTLHAAGMNVVIHYYHSEGEAATLCQTLNDARADSAITIQANLNVLNDCTLLIEQAFHKWGRLDALINNASKYYRSHLGEVTEDAWYDLMDSNLKAPFFLAQAAFPHLKQQQGVVVNITDIYGERPVLEYPVYTISKGALLAATKVLAKEMAPHVRVNAVSPGQIMWPEGENAYSSDEQQDIIAKISLKRAGVATDIAKAVKYLVQDADYVTGQVLSIDGGRLLFG